MGNFLSGGSTVGNVSTSHNNTSESETMEDVTCLNDNDEPVIEEQFHDTISDDKETRNKIKEEEMDEFKKQLNLKREQRREILARHKAEKKELENSLQDERESKIELCERNQLLTALLIKNNIEIPESFQCNIEKSYIADSVSHMREEIEKLRSSNVKLRCDLTSSNSALQTAYSDLAELSAQNTESIKQVSALKEVISVSKTMINLREQQLNELKNKLNEIEQSLADRETSILSTDLRQEYERQLQNIRTLRGLYEERARLADVSRQALSRDLEEHKMLLEVEVNKSKDLTNKVEELEAKISDLEDTVADKNTVISTSQEENRGLKTEMSGINKLFSQVLLGYKNRQDLDKLVHRLEENHGLLTQMAEKENGSEVSTELPKLLLEIVSQIDEKDCDSNSITFDGKSNQKDPYKQDVSKAEEIVQNLPKVWRVLMELLSHQSEAESNNAEKVTTCYKSVETKSGPVLVPSVSQTYIRLKDLILEKLTLIKEVNRMKQLNTHLESRLGEQERRLCLVTNELSKTWHVVGRLRRHHHQLHTHEKILKYELQQKRKLLNELKEELEYCREKWEQAREKNTQSEKDWRKLRTEFSNRKLKPESFNNSAESGYSDERPSEDSESNDESEYVEPKIKYKKKLKKSFETVIDSSTDFNLAEREDPASDMLDIAELPLDTQDNVACVSDSCKSEGFLKNETCEESEDEIEDMCNDSCLEEQSILEILPNECEKDKEKLSNSKNGENKMYDIPGTSTDIPSLCKPTTVSKLVKEHSDVMVQQDRLDNIESDNQSTSSKQQEEQLRNNTDSITSDIDFVHDSDNYIEKQGSLVEHTKIETLTALKADNNPNKSTPVDENAVQSIEVDFKAILENVKKQNDHLQIKDKRLKNIENGCSSLIENISNTLTSGDNMIAKLDSLHEKHVGHQNPNQTQELTFEGDLHTDIKPTTDIEEPSTSMELDHEARFAARDLRLKRLEEQTKSLVNIVNKTASKGVKIHYKLEELHNIYGSENSRSGTPSEDTEDISQNDDEVGEKNE